MAKKKFTYKTEKPTGRFKSFDASHHYIKYKKIVVGTIGHNAPHIIKLQIIKDDIEEDGNSNCEWKWVTLKHKSVDIDDAKTFLNAVIDIIFEKFNLYLEE